MSSLSIIQIKSELQAMDKKIEEKRGSLIHIADFCPLEGTRIKVVMDGTSHQDDTRNAVLLLAEAGNKAKEAAAQLQYAQGILKDLQLKL